MLAFHWELEGKQSQLQSLCLWHRDWPKCLNAGETAGLGKIEGWKIFLKFHFPNPKLGAFFLYNFGSSLYYVWKTIANVGLAFSDKLDEAVYQFCSNRMWRKSNKYTHIGGILIAGLKSNLNVSGSTSRTTCPRERCPSTSRTATRGSSWSA